MKKYITAFLCITVLCGIPTLSFGQGKVIHENHNNGKTSHQNAGSNGYPTNSRTTISITLACNLDGKRIYYTEKEWQSLPTDKKAQLNKVGLVVKSGNDNFLMSLNELPQWSNWETAKARTDNQMPTEKQWKIIKQNMKKINDALYTYGGSNISKRRWWNSGNSPSWTVMFYDGTEYDKVSPLTDEAGVWLATNDIDQGFREVTITKPFGQDYDFIGKESPYSKLRVVRHNAKYGFINQKGDLVVPLKYDALGCGYLSGNASGNDKMEWYGSTLMSVSQNGKWGYINKRGDVVIPLIFDRVEASSSTDNTPFWVSKNGLYGCIDTLGIYIVPLIYEDEIHFYNFQSSPSRAKKNGRWGFIRQNGEVAIPFKYESTRGFSDKHGLAQVSLNGKYGFINLSGDIAIPIKYEFADDFACGLAGVVVNGKVGFIDVNGNIVIPCVYDLEYSSDGNGKKLGFGMEFYSGVAFVKKGSKYAMIGQSGEFITNFKYDNVSSISSCGYYTAHIGNKTIYLDKGGNEYDSEQERYEKSDSILANQGYYYSQFLIGKKEYDKKNYVKGYSWFVKSAEGNDDDGQCHLGYYYYYGYKPVRQDYAEAYRLFSLAAKQGHKDACYFIGWMYEFGQYVASNKEKAIEWYKKSNGQRDSKKRIEALSK